MIVTTIHLAAGGERADPWPVLGNSGRDRLAIAALADLALARRLQIAAAAGDESPAGRGLVVVDGAPVPPVLAWALDALAGVSKHRDVDRAVRALRDIGPVVQAALLAAGDVAQQGSTGLLRKRPALVARPESVAAARQWIGMFPWPPTAEVHALALIATTGLPDQRRYELVGGMVGPQLLALDPFGPFDPNAPAPDGLPIGANGAELLGVLTTVLAATSDTTGWMNP